MEVQGRNCVSPNFGEFSNSSSDLGSAYIIFLFPLSCFDECWAFVKQKKEKKGKFSTRQHHKPVKRTFLELSLGNTVLSLPLA